MATWLQLIVTGITMDSIQPPSGLGRGRAEALLEFGTNYLKHSQP